MRRRGDRGAERSAIVAALAVLVVAWTCSAPPAEAATKKPVRQLLDSLPVSSSAVDGYTREAFRHWITVPGTKCNTRAVVLIDERKSGTVQGCTVTNGVWISAYDDVRVTNPRSLDIDHMVPLKEAWVSGAWRWTPTTRMEYANDLGYARSLIAVTASTNRSKGDRDPAQWLPAKGRCGYATAWIGVKYRWRLSVDSTEKSALIRALNGCPATMVVPPLASRQTNPDAQPTAAPVPTSEPDPGVTAEPAGVDPQFATCGEANAAGFGPYVRGEDPEYDWYTDRDGDGVVCER